MIYCQLYEFDSFLNGQLVLQQYTKGGINSISDGHKRFFNYELTLGTKVLSAPSFMQCAT